MAVRSRSVDADLPPVCLHHPLMPTCVTVWRWPGGRSLRVVLWGRDQWAEIPRDLRPPHAQPTDDGSAWMTAEVRDGAPDGAPAVAIVARPPESPRLVARSPAETPRRACWPLGAGELIVHWWTAAEWMRIPRSARPTRIVSCECGGRLLAELVVPD